MNRLITTIVQLALWAPIFWAISLAVAEQKRMKNK